MHGTLYSPSSKSWERVDAVWRVVLVDRIIDVSVAVSVAGALSPAKSPLSNSEALNQDVFCSNQESFYVVVSKQTGVHKGI